MSWANPAALWLLAALLLLLFVRRRPPQRRLAVANLYLWSAATAPDAPRLTRRLRRSLLLFLQAAFMAAVIAAIARPLLSFGGGHVAVLVDVSMSMGARHRSATRLDAAKAHVRQLLEALPRSSRVHLWTAAAIAQNHGEFGSRDSALTAAIQGLQATDTAADLESAVALARNSTPPPSRIHVVTDTPAAPPVEDVEWTRIAEPAENVALTQLSARRRSADQSIELLVAAVNYGTRAASFEAVISQNDAVLARQPMRLSPGGEASAVLTLPQTSGTVFARLEAGDALAADDGRAVAIPPADPLRVLIINGSHFVEQALSTRPGTLVVRGTPDDPRAGAGYDVIVCDGCEDVPVDAGSAGLLILPPRSGASRGPAPITVNVHARAHPIVDMVSLDSVLAAPIEIALRRNLGDSPGAATIDDHRVIAHAAALPLVVAHEDGLRRVVELRLDPSAGFALESAFPMLIANSLEWLAAPRRTAVTLRAGDVLQVRPAAAQSPAKHSGPVVTRPDGSVVLTSERNGTYVTQTERAGVYRIAHGTQSNDLIVTPHVEGESDLSAGAAPEPSTTALRPAIGTGWDATGLLFVLALTFLAAEWRLKTSDRGTAT
jgi:hypothetical protein